MKKNLKYLIIAFVVLMIILATEYLLIIRKTAKTPAIFTKAEVAALENLIIRVDDPSIMTVEEKIEAKLGLSTKVRVFKRDATGKILVYKVLTEEEQKNILTEIENNKKNISSEFGSDIEIMNDDTKNQLALFHLAVYQVVERSENGNVTAYKLLKLNDEQNIDLDLMTAIEKEERGFDTNLKIQVLQRGAGGKVLTYKIIKDDSQIMTKY